MRVIGSWAVHQDLWVFLFPGPWHLASHSSLTSHPVALNPLSPFDPSVSPPVYAVIHYSPLPLLPSHLSSDRQQGSDSKRQLSCKVTQVWNDFSSVIISSNCAIQRGFIASHTHTHTNPKQKQSLMLRGGICIKWIERVPQAISDFLEFKAIEKPLTYIAEAQALGSDVGLRWVTWHLWAEVPSSIKCESLQNFLHRSLHKWLLNCKPSTSSGD